MKRRFTDGPLLFGPGKKVYIHYKASEDKGGEVIYQTNRDDGPDVLVFGSDANESQLELLLLDKAEGAKVTGWLKHDPVDPEQEWTVPRSSLPKNGEPAAPMQGGTLIMLDDEDIPITPRITYVDDFEVRLSLNSPWAGKIMWFEGVVVRVLPCSIPEFQTGIPDDYRNAIAQLIGSG